MFCYDYFYRTKIVNAGAYGDAQHKLAPYLLFELESKTGFNTYNIDFVADLVAVVLAENRTWSVGVLTSCHKQTLSVLAKFSNFSTSTKKNLSVTTIEEAQGQEKDVIVFCCAPCTDAGSRVLSEPSLVSVALTRARKSLFLCGNFHTLRRLTPFWDNLVQDAKNRSVYNDTTLDKINLSLKNIILKK